MQSLDGCTTITETNEKLEMKYKREQVDVYIFKEINNVDHIFHCGNIQGYVWKKV